MKHIDLSMALLMILLLAPHDSNSQPAEEGTAGIHASDEGAIVKNARRIVGVSGRQSATQTVTSRVVIVEGVDAPVPDSLRSVVAGRRLWRVDFDDVLIREVKSDQGVTVEMRRSITAYLDSLSGKLIMVQSIRPSDRIISDREMPLAERERALLSSPKYRGLPDSLSLDFVSVLQHCPFSPHLAERIAGVYIYEPKNNYPDSLIPVWVISLVGIPPVPVIGVPDMDMSNPVPEYMRNARQVVIDARTGKELSQGGAPARKLPCQPCARVQPGAGAR
ncbi:MAG: hypothetical protein AB1772_11595 [Candidatus Zixiibacteriota bacterium]